MGFDLEHQDNFIHNPMFIGDNFSTGNVEKNLEKSYPQKFYPQNNNLWIKIRVKKSRNREGKIKKIVGRFAASSSCFIVSPQVNSRKNYIPDFQ